MEKLLAEPMGTITKPALHQRSRIAALVPHYKCEQWLAGCLRSLVAQTRLPDAIIVVDDGSPEPPVGIVRDFPSVTLLHAPENAGLFSVLQQAIEATDFDGYMFQDADDWSGPRRLELLLAEAERTGAELIGCQEMRIFPEQMDAEPHIYPVEVNARIMENPSCYGVLHPSSIVSRDLVVRLGGYASMRFAGDAEFQRRAIHMARVTNIRSLCYFRRVRPGALTSAPDTGHASPARESVRRTLIGRSTRAVAAAKRGSPVDVSPLSVGPRIDFEHLVGPPVLTRDERTASTLRVALTEPARGDINPRLSLRSEAVGDAAFAPIFIVGAPRSGIGLLHAVLAQHPKLLPLTGVLVVGGSPSENRVTFENGHESLFGQLQELGGRLVDSSPAYSFVMEQLIERFPNARFLNVVRDPVEVVSLIARSGKEEGLMTGAVALESWRSHVTACAEAERKLGPGVVLRVAHEAMASQPEAVLREVFTFVGEAYDQACVAPLLRDEGPVPEVGSSNHLPEVKSPSLGLLSLCAGMIWREILAGQPTPEIAQSLPVLAVQLLPAEAVAIVFSDGDERYAKMGGAVGWHFPQDPSGAFTGANPADSNDAVNQLSALRSRGAGYLIVPQHALWWLEYYLGLRKYIEESCRVVAVYEGIGAVFAFKSADATP
jgi:Glycosyl transferase family 2/Sulfotransferase family